MWMPWACKFGMQPSGLPPTSDTQQPAPIHLHRKLARDPEYSKCWQTPTDLLCAIIGYCYSDLEYYERYCDASACQRFAGDQATWHACNSAGTVGASLLAAVLALLFALRE